MKILAVVVILLHVKSTVGAECRSTWIDKHEGRGVASNCSIHCLDWAKLDLDGVRFLSLANCGISNIVNILMPLELTEVNLMNNRLQELPSGLLQHVTGLTRLNLNGNPITAIPLSLIRSIDVTFDCSCGVLRDLIDNCRDAVNCTENSFDSLGCDVPNEGRVLNVSDFYRSECQGQSLVIVYVLVPLAIVAILGVSLLVLMKLCSKRSQSASPNKRQSISSADQGQQRYVSAANLKDAAAVLASPGRSGQGIQQQQPAHKDYENMLMGESGGAQGICNRKQQSPDDTYYLESDPASNIYLNEQPIYCNYTGSEANPEDDVYIIPDK
uniref:uncharacterized protein n=1 Tax=Pristiophorus japonicus TaxID=55135 RepID=UPI00398F575B